MFLVNPGYSGNILFQFPSFEIFLIFNLNVPEISKSAVKIVLSCSLENIGGWPGHITGTRYDPSNPTSPVDGTLWFAYFWQCLGMHPSGDERCHVTT